ncbi:MAG: cupin domain-containing protein, partial [Bacilli bacterium]
MQIEDILPTLSPYVRIAMESLHQSSLTIHEREIWDYEILYLKEGHLLITVEDKTYEGLPGDIFVFKPRQRHSIYTVGDSIVR